MIWVECVYNSKNAVNIPTISIDNSNRLVYN